MHLDFLHELAAKAVVHAQPGEQFIAPRAFNWAPGSKHTLSVTSSQPKNTFSNLVRED